jgi:Holliday junction resolvase-like predicted endonuclease
MKYCLREEIEKFEFMIDKEEEKVKKLTQKAKEYLESNNKKSSMAVCKEVIDKQKKISTISVRKNVLENQITQLEYN